MLRNSANASSLLTKRGSVFDGELAALRRLLSTERILSVDYAETYSDISIPKAHVTYREGNRVQYRFAPEEVSTADLIGAILQKFKIVDISVQEPDIEELIKTVYEDNSALEQKFGQKFRETDAIDLTNRNT